MMNNCEHILMNLYLKKCLKTHFPYDFLFLFLFFFYVFIEKKSVGMDNKLCFQNLFFLKYKICLVINLKKNNLCNSF